MQKRKLIFLYFLICTAILLSLITVTYISAEDNTSLKIDDGIGRYDTTSILTAKLVSKDKGVFNKNVSFYINNTFIGYNQTDSKGIVKLNYLVTEVGTYIVKVKFGGDSNYLASENTSILKVPKTPTVIEADNYFTTKKNYPAIC